MNEILRFLEAAQWSWLVVALPLLGAGLIGLFGPTLRDRSHWPAILGVAGALAVAIWLFVTVPGVPAAGAYGAAAHEAVETAGYTPVVTHEPVADVSLFDWMLTGSRGAAAAKIEASLRVDALTVMMLLTVCTVSLLVVIYSRSYMRDHHGHPERGYERYFAFMALFVASMCALVLAGNFVVLYLGWELVGLCSYLLIGFYYQRPSAAEAAKKAFIVNRIGDFGFALGVLLIYLTYGRLDYQSVFAATGAAFQGDAAEVGRLLGLTGGAAEATAALIRDRVTVISLLLFAGAVGKSAQIPLYVWLPDAMEGPTPVSALIHAATMVTAGVYMVARCGALFTHSPVTLEVVALIGLATALFSATIALAQFDIKRILAYSTISQLGYMFLGLGVYAAGAAMFHLYTHAFFKALLFLAAGSVMHAMNGVIDVRQFGGLKRVLPVTAATFWVGGLALAGFPLLSGFWSKDEIVAAAMAANPILGWLAMLTALLTAFYTFRMIFLAFHGRYRTPPEVERPAESGPWMTVPLILLAVGAAFAGYVGVSLRGGGFVGFLEPGGRFQAFLAGPLGPYERAAQAAEHGGHGLLYMASLVAIAGIAAAWLVYVKQPGLAAAAARVLGPVYTLLGRKYYVDEIYDRIVVTTLWALAQLCYVFDRWVIDGVLFAITLIPRTIGLVSRQGQLGAVQGYALAMMVLAVAVLLVVLAVT